MASRNHKPLRPALGNSSHLGSKPLIVMNYRENYKWALKMASNCRRISGERPCRTLRQLRTFLQDRLDRNRSTFDLTTIKHASLPSAGPGQEIHRTKEQSGALTNILITAFVACVDLMSGRIAFKMTTESVEALVKYHGDYVRTTLSTATGKLDETSQQSEMRQDAFKQAVTEFAFYTDAELLASILSSPMKRLPDKVSEQVKRAIMDLFPPKPSRPRGEDVSIMSIRSAQPCIFTCNLDYMRTSNRSMDARNYLPSSEQLWNSHSTTISPQFTSSGPFQLHPAYSNHAYSLYQYPDVQNTSYALINQASFAAQDAVSGKYGPVVPDSNTFLDLYSSSQAHMDICFAQLSWENVYQIPPTFERRPSYDEWVATSHIQHYDMARTSYPTRF